MTLTKIALTVLGTVGLAAGTVFAVAEPAPAELPQAATQANACSRCSGHTCGTAKCMAAAAACTPVAASACAENAACARNCEEDGACRPETAEGDAACTAAAAEPACNPLSSILAAACDSAQDCSAEESCTKAAPGHTRKLTFSFGISSNGPILRLTSGPIGSAEGACPAATSGCGTMCQQVAACRPASPCVQANCEGATCTKESCTESGTCAKCCDAAARLITTACEAQPACATSGLASLCAASTCPASACHAAACSASSCSASVCDGSACEDGACAASKCASCPHTGCRSQSVGIEQPSAMQSACSVEACDCEDCCCESCDCVTDAACPPGVLCPVAARFHQILTSGCGPRIHSDPVDGNVHSYDSISFAEANEPGANTPGRVRLTHLPDLRFWAAPPQFPPQANMVFTSFTAPVVAPVPPAAARSPRGMEGSWTRSAGPWTVTFAIENGRLRVTCTTEGATVRFSGTCGVSDDGQIFGVLDEADISSDVQEGTAEARAIAVRLIDQPFAVRFRFDGDSLIVKDLRCAGLPPDQVRQIACGRFERE